MSVLGQAALIVGHRVEIEASIERAENDRQRWAGADLMRHALGYKAEPADAKGTRRHTRMTHHGRPLDYDVALSGRVPVTRRRVIGRNSKQHLRGPRDRVDMQNGVLRRLVLRREVGPRDLCEIDLDCLLLRRQ